MSNRLLPRDLQNEILVRLPVKSLLRFQGVCQSWKSFISSPRFISMHTQYSESTDNYAHLLHWEEKNDKDGVIQYQLHHIDGSFNKFQKLEYPCQIRDREYSFALECKGLILFTMTMIKDEIDDHRFEPLILWNPAIRMSITLPRPCIDVPANRGRCVHGFGFDHKSNDYKVVRIVYGRYSSFSPKAELYKLCTGTWKTVKVADDFKYTIYACMQALVNGAIHWLGNHLRGWPSSGTELEFGVVLFHICDEEFQVMKFPDHLISSLKKNYAEIGVYGGLLSLMEYNRQEFIHFSCSIWLMKEYGVAESWTKQFTIDLKNVLFTSKGDQQLTTMKDRGTYGRARPSAFI
ncbi:F-box protein CPR1-like [Corylus avellana]|uniref:F-box protein CPR1-like n=1 Tax=Corylus avellana TaxID=13451 RepID=UPI00286BB040|nr:F-box protein CPR1-like [Corylus avellana]XP_059445494.1 F-box protein CPR1-like [Corylus avellana]